MDIRSFQVQTSERLDVAIANALDLSRTFAKELVIQGYVQIDNKIAIKASMKVQARGDHHRHYATS